MKTFGAIFCLAAITGGPAVAEDELLTVLAGCAGRLSAQVEHEWLMLDTQAERTEQMRDNLTQILTLLTPPETESRVLSLRINAKHAQARLLTRATFNSDRADARRAARRATNEVADCASLLLS